MAFLSTLSLRRATFSCFWYILNLYISIHALLAESDSLNLPSRPIDKISIHALLAESDAVCVAVQSPALQFLSTLSLRRATTKVGRGNQTIINFYPRSPCGERLILPRSLSVKSNFYPRSPCGERQRLCTILYSWPGNFYPRSPCGERPGSARGISSCTAISIHALLAESDLSCA